MAKRQKGKSNSNKYSSADLLWLGEAFRSKKRDRIKNKQREKVVERKRWS